MPLFQEETIKATSNFNATQKVVSIKLIYAICKIKIAAARANLHFKQIDSTTAISIENAARAVLSGKYNSEFITDQIQGGAGTSVHSNVNEVISTLATQESKLNIHPNDHVNKGQSTNDVVPTAMRVVFLQEIDKLTKNIDTLTNDLEVYAHKYKNLPRMGRTHLQDAVPLTIEMRFLAYAEFFKRSSLQLRAQKELLFRNNLGGTAIGTGLNSVEGFSEKINKELVELTGYPLYPAKNLIDATQNSDDFLNLSAQVNTFAGGLNKIVNDLRLLVSGPRAGIAEFKLTEVQKGSTIMPGKANPVVLEMVNQICQQVFGNETAAFHALISGQLELNVMLPLFFKNTLESMELLSYVVSAFSEKVLPLLSPNQVQIKEHLNKSLYAVTALSKRIGYDRASKIVTDAIQQGLTIRDILIKEGALTDSEIDSLLDPLHHVKPSTPPSA